MKPVHIFMRPTSLGRCMRQMWRARQDARSSAARCLARGCSQRHAPWASAPRPRLCTDDWKRWKASASIRSTWSCSMAAGRVVESCPARSSGAALVAVAGSVDATTVKRARGSCAIRCHLTCVIGLPWSRQQRRPGTAMRNAAGGPRRAAVRDLRSSRRAKPFEPREVPPFLGATTWPPSLLAAAARAP